MDYDYIIAGGGTAGCVLASRLSEDPSITVCLIEAGGSGDGRAVRGPALVAALTPGRSAAVWGVQTLPQRGLNGRRGYLPGGMGLGGSSAINAMHYTRGHPADYDEWANLGAEGWDWHSVLPYFLRAENNERGASSHHAVDGPWQIADQRQPRPITRAFLQSAAENQIPLNADFNGDHQEGAGLFQVTRFHSGPHKGERCSSATAYLHPVLDRPNLVVMTHARTERIVLDDEGRAAGLMLRQGRDQRTLFARREVIVAQGTFGSPQLLMLSGIGPEDELRHHRIPVVHALPGVGQNLQDHLAYAISHTSRRADVVGLNPAGLARLVKAGLDWRRTRDGLFASPLTEGCAYVRSAPRLLRPDLQMRFTVGLFDLHLRNLSWTNGFSGHVLGLRPESRGTVGLIDDDPRSSPRVDPNFLSHPKDLVVLAAGARIMEEILSAPPLAPWRGRRLHPLDGSEGALIADIRARAEPMSHASGTCRMGTDPLAVTDPQLRVRGIEGLRVVDGSVMPRLVRGNTTAAVIMIAERAAELIRRDDT